MLDKIENVLKIIWDILSVIVLIIVLLAPILGALVPLLFYILTYPRLKYDSEFVSKYPHVGGLLCVIWFCLHIWISLIVMGLSNVI